MQNASVHRRAGCSRTSPSAFTLIELLVVMAVAGMLLGLSGVAVTSLSKGGTLNKSLADVAGTLEQARQYAVAQNTYVWVAFLPGTMSGNSTVSMVVLASKNGADPTPWSAYGTVPNSQIGLLTRVKTFDQIGLSDAATFTDRIPELTGATAVTKDVNSLANGTAKFSVLLPGTTTPVVFDRVIQFTPSGEAHNASNLIDVIEFGMQPTHGTVADEKNVAAIRVNGLTGQTQVYRP
ncbi:hypothetical protein BH09VER1_BH09VER1_27610 [soil metagenome]